ncbi:MAG: putative Ig domain-containing protein, partial [Acidobacteriota bacterium]
MNCRQDVLALWQVAVRKAMKHRLIVCALSLMAVASVTASQSPRAQVQQPPATLHGADALERLKQNSQYDSLQAALHQARFSVSRVAHSPLGEAAWHAPNPAAGYDAYVTESGVSIALASQSIASLSLHSVGYGNALQTVTSGTISGDKQTITIERDGIREWFLNGAEGLEHGFTLSQAPRVRQADALLRLALQVSENWRAVASANGGQVTLHDRAGTEVIEYGKLTAYDAVGRKLAAQLTVADAQVIIEVDDRAAQYPLTIDPLFTLQKQLLANDSAADDLLGHAVALDGDTALIGAPYDDVMEQDQGSAYVFVRNGETWTQQARLVANDGANLDLFGWAVALDGDTALIGAYNGPGTASTDQGAAYVFVRNGTVWTQQKRLNASDGVMAGLYATALAISGDTALVGAPDFRTNANFAPGTVYVYVRNGTDWTQQTKLFASDIGNNDRFGSAIALQGNTALIGAPSNAVTVLNQGAAYIFVRNGSSWTQQMPILTAGTDAHVDDAFGNAVALNGGKALIGTPGYGNDDSGKVYLFQHGASGWALTDSLRPPNPTPSEVFGMSVAMNGSTTVIGASLRLFAPGIDHRSAYVYLYAGEFFLLRHLGPDLGSAEDRFGYAVAVDGNTVLVGAYRANITAADQGAAYVFTVHDSLHHEQQKLFAPDGKAQEVFGDAVALDADTLAIGADEALVNNQSLRGAVYIFVRSGTTWTFQQKVVAPDGAASDQFGQAVALDGDTLAVGAYKDDIGGNQDQGSVYVFTRSGTSWTFQQKLTAAGIDGLPLDKLGTAVALRDQTLLAGAPGYSGGRGTVFVFTRNGTLWQEQLKLSANDAAAGDAFGSAVAFRGEMAIIGAPADDNGTKIDQGSAYIFARNGTNWAFQQKLLANDGAADDYFGGAVAIKGDTVAVGAPLANIGTQGDQGAAYVFTRQNAAWTQSPKLFANDGSQGYHFGQSVALDDGILAVGAPLDNQARGAAYIYTGLGTLWAFQQKLLGSDTVRDDYLGSSVAVAGDTIAVGASGDDFSDGVNKGSTYVFVSPHCPIITLGPDSLPDGLPGIAYDYQLTATGSVAGDYVFSLSYGTLPSGLTLDIPGRLHGTPSAPGTYHFTITATFALSGCTTRRNYTITIAPCPAINLTPSSLPNGVVGAAYDQTLTASANGSSLSSFMFAVTAGALAPGLSLNPTGSLSGTPTQAGSYNFTITATSSGCTATQNYTLTILATCPTLTVAPPLLPNGRIGVAYNQTLTVTGGTAPYTFALKVGSTIPPGLSFVNGTLSGTPTQTGTYGFQTRIKDANNCEVTQGYSVTINPPCEPVVINPPTLPNATVGMAYSQTLTVSVTALGVNFVVSAGALPPGLTLAANGNLSGQPTQGGNYDFTVTATANGCTGTRAYTLSVTGNGGLQFYPLAKPIRLLDTRG